MEAAPADNVTRVLPESFAKQDADPLDLSLWAPYIGPLHHSPPAGSLIVQKFGGSSVKDAACIRRAARRLASTHKAGHRVVGVVSAMGDTTDELLELAGEVSPRPQQKHLDALLSTGEVTSMTLLVMALADLGVKARTFTGEQAGLITDENYGSAHIIDIKPQRVSACLERGEIAIVAGFQGTAGDSGRTTTLGRGGSDLTAVALAAALGASICEIYTDVDGVHSADPRIVPKARKIDVLSSEAMLEFAASGAKILHLRCVEYAHRFNVPLHVRSAFIPDPGTLVLPVREGHWDKLVREHTVVSAVTCNNSGSAITVADLPIRSEATTQIFEDLAESGLSISRITRSIQAGIQGTADVVFALPTIDAPAAVASLTAMRETTGYGQVKVQDHIGQITVTGLGMRSSAEVLYSFFKVLSDAAIPVTLIETSDLSISAVIPAGRLEEALRNLEMAFGLRTGQHFPALDQQTTGNVAVRG